MGTAVIKQLRRPYNLYCVNPAQSINQSVIRHPVPDWVKPSFVIFDIRALRRSGLSVRVPGCQKLQMTAQPRLAQDA